MIFDDVRTLTLTLTRTLDYSNPGFYDGFFEPDKPLAGRLFVSILPFFHYLRIMADIGTKTSDGKGDYP